MKYAVSAAISVPILLLSLQVGSFAQLHRTAKPVRARRNAVQIQTNAAGQVVTGPLSLSLAGELSNVATVEYKMGNFRIGMSTEAPFTVTWNSALSGDGNMQIEAIARDGFGNIVSDTYKPVSFFNYGNKAEVLNGGLPTVLTGTVPFTAHGYDSVHYPAFWLTSIDGEQIPARFTDHNATHDVTLTQNLDTTVYPNGIHEFYVTFHSNDYNNPNPPAGGEDYRGMVMQNVDIENGRTFMEVNATYLHVYTSVGATIALGCSRTYTNGDSDACIAPQWTPADPSVAAVDAAGNLQALREGYTDVTLTEGGKTTLVHVWAKNDPDLPHFTTDGAMSTSYVDGKSIFIVAPYLLAPGYLAADTALLAEVKRAGINTLTRGIYINPSDLTTSYSSWLSTYNATVAPDLNFAAVNGFRMIGTGDDIARNIGLEAFRSLNWPPAKQAIQFAVQQFARSGTAVSLEMIDEASFIWGPNPTPPGVLGATNSMQSIVCSGKICTVTWPNLSDNAHHDTISNGLTFTLTGNSSLNTPAGTTYTVQNATADTFDFVPAVATTGTFTPQTSPSTEYEWFARSNTCQGVPCNPPVLDSAISTITSWVRGAPSTVALSYPAGGISYATTQRDWMGEGSPSDYASHYWDTLQLRPNYVFGKGIRESGYYMLSLFYGRQPYMQLNRPQLMLISLSGTSYFKNSPVGTDGYNPPVDGLYKPGNVPKTTASSMFAAAAAGAAGLRLYQFDDADDYRNQKEGGPGGLFQVGAAPFYGETNLWRAMGYASNLMTKVLQPYLLGAPGNSPALGRNIVTGVRNTTSGTMLIVVNTWDSARQVKIDFTPYDSGFGVTRYKVNDTYIKSALLPDAAGETVQMESGETLVYIFPNSSAPSGLDNITFMAPAPGDPSKVSVTYGYIYKQNVAGFGETVDCGQGCVLAIDRRLGDVYTQYNFMDSATGEVQHSPIQALGRANRMSVPVARLARASIVRKSTGRK